MVSFSDPVAIPNYNALRSPAIDFSWLADLPNQYYKGQQNQFQQRQRQRTEQLQQPINSTDPSAIAQTLLQRGGADYAAALFPFLQQQQNLKAAGAIDPMLPGPSSQPQVGNPPPASAAGALPTNMKTPVSAQSGDPGTGTITDIVTDKYGETSDAGRMIARVAMTMNVDPNAPLSQGQQVRVAGLVKRYGGDKTTDAGNGISVTAPANETPTARVADAFAAVSGGGDQPATPQRTGAVAPQPQPTPAVQPQQQGAAPGPIGPQVPLPRGYTDHEQAILALRERAAQVERIAPGQAKFFDAWAERIEKSIQPMDVRQGQTLLDPRTGKVIFRSEPTNPTAFALQRYLSENPNATPEQIQAFVQAGRSGRSAIAMYMNRFIAENPNATADQIKRAAQQYTTQTTAQNRFLSGPQGNTIRSLNVVVSHLQTMQDLGDALKNGNVRVFNSVAQRFAEETGSPAPTNFDTAKQIVGAEVIKALGVAGAGSQSERQEAADAFNRARSPAQLVGVISAARKLLVGQLEGLRRQYIASTGLTGSSFDEMLQPETRQFFSQDRSRASEGNNGGKQPAPPAGFQLVQ